MATNRISPGGNASRNDEDDQDDQGGGEPPSTASTAPKPVPPTDEPARFPTSEPRVPEEKNPSPGGEPQARPPEDEPLRGPTSRPGSERVDERRAPGDAGQRVRPDSSREDLQAAADAAAAREREISGIASAEEQRARAVGAGERTQDQEPQTKEDEFLASSASMYRERVSQPAGKAMADAGLITNIERRVLGTDRSRQALEGAGYGVAELGNVPSHIIQGRETAEFLDPRGSYQAVDVGVGDLNIPVPVPDPVEHEEKAVTVGEEMDTISEAAATNPYRFGGSVFGSAAGGAAATTGAMRVARSSRVPKSFRAGKGRKTSTDFDKIDTDVARSADEAAPSMRDRLPDVEVRRDPMSGPLDVDPMLKQQIKGALDSPGRGLARRGDALRTRALSRIPEIDIDEVARGAGRRFERGARSLEAQAAVFRGAERPGSAGVWGRSLPKDVGEAPLSMRALDADLPDVSFPSIPNVPSARSRPGAAGVWGRPLPKDVGETPLSMRALDADFPELPNLPDIPSLQRRPGSAGVWGRPLPKDVGETPLSMRALDARPELPDLPDLPDIPSLQRRPGSAGVWGRPLPKDVGETPISQRVLDARPEFPDLPDIPSPQSRPGSAGVWGRPLPKDVGETPISQRVLDARPELPNLPEISSSRSRLDTSGVWGRPLPKDIGETPLSQRVLDADIDLDIPVPSYRDGTAGVFGRPLARDVGQRGFGDQLTDAAEYASEATLRVGPIRPKQDFVDDASDWGGLGTTSRSDDLDDDIPEVDLDDSAPTGSGGGFGDARVATRRDDGQVMLQRMEREFETPTRTEAPTVSKGLSGARAGAFAGGASALDPIGELDDELRDGAGVGLDATAGQGMLSDVDATSGIDYTGPGDSVGVGETLTPVEDTPQITPASTITPQMTTPTTTTQTPTLTQGIETPAPTVSRPPRVPPVPRFEFDGSGGDSDRRGRGFVDEQTEFGVKDFDEVDDLVGAGEIEADLEGL